MERDLKELADVRHAHDQVKGCETFVVNEILKQASWADVETRAYHYQRRDEDVDLVLEVRAGVVVASVAQTTPLGDRLWAVPYSGLWA